MTTQISNLSGVVAAAKVEAERAEGTLAEAEAHRDVIKGRIAEKQAERTAIVAARKAGAQTKSDGAKLMVIEADTQNLGELLSAADAVVVKAIRDATEAKRVLALAESDLARRTDEELLARLVEHAEKVDGILLGTIQEINAACGRLGRPAGREPWAPTIQLAEALQRRHLTREFRK